MCTRAWSWELTLFALWRYSARLVVCNSAWHVDGLLFCDGKCPCLMFPPLALSSRGNGLRFKVKAVHHMCWHVSSACLRWPLALLYAASIAMIYSRTVERMRSELVERLDEPVR